MSPRVSVVLCCVLCCVQVTWVDTSGHASSFVDTRGMPPIDCRAPLLESYLADAAAANGSDSVPPPPPPRNLNRTTAEAPCWTRVDHVPHNESSAVTRTLVASGIRLVRTSLWCQGLTVDPDTIPLSSGPVLSATALHHVPPCLLQCAAPLLAFFASFDVLFNAGPSFLTRDQEPWLHHLVWLAVPSLVRLVDVGPSLTSMHRRTGIHPRS